MTKRTKLKVRGKEANGCFAIVDIESNDNTAPKFYEEVQTLERAERFVHCWNAFEEGGLVDALLAACEAMAKEWDTRGKIVYQTGAPAAIFAIKAAITKAKEQK